MKIKKIAVLTSGGDAPGMNSTIFGIFCACEKHNVKLYGVIGGYDGLIDNKFIPIDYAMLDGRINRGGSLLKSGRSSRFLKANYFKKAIANLVANKIDGLIVIGGDGSTRGAMALRDAGVNIITLPGTIDNDLNFSFTIGFDTATNNIVHAVDNITDCLSAFNYGTVIKIMGRDCTALIESVAKALHTEYLITDAHTNIDILARKIKKSHDGNHLPPVVLVLESVMDVNALAIEFTKKTGFQWRSHILGYIQRGGTPSAFDRRYGYAAGEMATDCLANNDSGFAIGMDGDKLVKKSFENTII